MLYKISVIIPTFKKHDGLFRLLASLQKQSITDFEIIVVNKNTEDGLKEKMAIYNSDAKIKVNYINFDRDGATGARKAGIEIAENNILLFLDDDETCVKNIIEEYINVFEEYEQLAAAGGPCIVQFEEEPPQWISNYIKEKKIENVWGHFYPLEEQRVAESVNLWGGNLAVKKEVFEWTNWKIDLVNGNLIGEGDSGLIKDIADKKGLLMAYVPSAKIYHHITAARMNVKHLRWSASYLMNTRMYRKYKNKKNIVFSVLIDFINTIYEYKGLWLKDFFYAKYRTDYASLDIQYLAAMGYWKIRYLYWVLLDKKVKKYLLSK